MNNRPAGTVGLCCHETARYTRFWNSFVALQMPPAKVIFKLGVDVAKMRNEIIREMEGEWVFFMDDDHTFSPELLNNLLKRNVDVVQALCLKRYAPFGPVHMGPQVPDSQAHWQYALTKTDPKELKEVHIVGAAGTLIKRRVLEGMCGHKLGSPGWKTHCWFEVGKIEPDGMGEDMIFCRKAKAAGYKVYTDLGNPMGHINVGVVTPVRKEDGSWVTEIEFGNQRIEMPTAEAQFITDEYGNVKETER